MRVIYRRKFWSESEKRKEVGNCTGLIMPVPTRYEKRLTC